jgi:hemerythrin-like domain-containing protein
MDLFSKIKDEHGIIIGTVIELIGSDPQTRRDRMDDLIIRIIAHMDAEEQTIYQSFEELDAVPRSLALRQEEEHHVARLMMTELNDRGITDDHWAAKLQVFRGILEQHMRVEESAMFDMAKDYFVDEDIERMTRRYEETEAGLFKDSRIGPLLRH